MPETSDNLVIAGNDFTDEASVLDVLDHVLNAGVAGRNSDFHRDSHAIPSHPAGTCPILFAK